MNSIHIIGPLAAFLMTLLVIPVLRKIAFRINMVDKPNFRKVHTLPIPLIGGVGIFIATTLALGLALPFDLDILGFKNIYLAMSILLMMGVIDDFFELRATMKLAIQLILAHFIFSQGIKIESLHGIFGIYELADWMQYGLTVVVIAGAVNAFNLMDGIDGLAAGLAIAGFAVFTVLAVLTNQFLLALVFLTYIGGLFGFLRFNLSKSQKVFIGDAGSLMMGFILVVSGIRLIQSAQNTANVSLVILGVVAVMLIPVFDALRVFRKRMKSGKSPFNPDKTHLHHLVLTTGLRHKASSLGIVGLMSGIILIGFISYQLVGLTVAFIAMLFLFSFVTSLLQFHNRLMSWKTKIKRMENINH
ncbi:glycosyltransferase family 4 protein [Cognataquiflexum aquatile]|uniref:glycosyltransferase family 4 protein n=1 Tax=Cognataquiflexum aquatile TaxID=2249427 RepID=UPI000DEA0A11|nr:MraY family glycosyltransferase [Cognataquiflexum aquatile]